LYINKNNESILDYQAGYEIIKKGIYKKHMVEIECRPESIKRSADALSYIQQEWDKAKNQDTIMFAGNLAAVTGYTASDERIWINTIHTTYDDFFVSKTDEFLAQFPYEMPANPLSVGMVLVTNDDKISFEIRSKRMALQKNTVLLQPCPIKETEPKIRSLSHLGWLMRMTSQPIVELTALTPCDVKSLRRQVFQNAAFLKSAVGACMEQIPQTDILAVLWKNHLGF
jgi:hypothetical protein